MLNINYKYTRPNDAARERKQAGEVGVIRLFQQSLSRSNALNKSSHQCPGDQTVDREAQEKKIIPIKSQPIGAQDTEG